MHEGFDGQKQRNALSAAERALRALGAGDAAKARKSAGQAAMLDQIGLYPEFAAAVGPLADRLDNGGTIDDADWDAVAGTLGLGPLSALVDELRGS